MMSNSKRSHPSSADLNNNSIVSTSSSPAKKKKSIVTSEVKQHAHTIGQIKELRMLNFMCHKNFEIQFHPTPMQIVTGANGSGKSTIANAICLCLGAQARTTGRTSVVQSFIRKGETSAELTVTLANEGPEAYKPELYGKEIRITRKIFTKRSDYKVLSDRHKVISTQKDTVAEIIQALSISPENPLCVLHQEVAKTFLLNNDAQRKYQFYMKVSQLDQIKQAYEEGVCTVESLVRRVEGMKQKHDDMLRAIEPLNREIKQMENRINQEAKKHALETELIAARNAESEQELIDSKNELDQTQKSRDIIDRRMIVTTDQMKAIDQRIEELTKERADLEKDLSDANGLREMNYRFGKQKKEIELLIYRLSNECEKYHQSRQELEEERSRLQKQIDEFQNFSQQSNHENEEREKFEQELRDRQQQQSEWDKTMASFTDDMNVSNESIRKKQSTIGTIQNELKLKQQELEELKKIEKDKTDVYGTWMADCLRAIENEHRFHRKPIGPIGRYIHCTDARWSYAVEKHLGPSMSAFICSDNHDEKILLDIFDKFARNYRPMVSVRKYSEQVHDVSGTLHRIRNANLLSIYEVLRVDNVTVACTLIDFKQIEATILVEDMQHAKRIQQSGVLRWPMVDKKVKQVVEAWTYDGSNIKLDKAFRIYTNDKQPARYFTSNNTQSLSTQELETEIKRLNDQINQMNSSITAMRKIRQTTIDNFENMKRASAENKKKIKELNKELERMNSMMPVTQPYSMEELTEKLNECNAAHEAANRKFEEARESKEVQHQELADITQKFENIAKKVETNIQQREALLENISAEQSERQQLQQQITKLSKKSIQLDEDIQKCQEKLDILIKNQPKKSKTSKTTTRSVRDVQQELDGINRFLKSYEDTQATRRQVIEEYKIKRDNAQLFKKTCDQCFREVQRLDKFVNKRKERFGRIADQHQYLLRHKFKNLMEKHQFDDCDIKIDHKKEELEIIIKKNQRSVASLSGGERSISTFCFLLALWGSIYQPFRLLDEIDIYMDNEKRNSSLQLLYENTQYYSSSQHVIFTPQTIDVQKWKKLSVPVFSMPAPKRSLQ